MKVAVKNLKGEQVGEVDLPASIFEVEVNQPLMHQALIRQNANAHLGTHKVKTRAEVARTNKKPFKQKGTGNARQGDRKAPHWVGGGVAFGPVVRSYAQSMPKQMRQGAIRSALTQKAKDQAIIVVDKWESDGKTKQFAQSLDALGVKKGLLVLPSRLQDVERAARNIPNCKYLLASYLNIRDMFKYQQLVISVDSIKKIEDWLG
jgi:large subunit ribosomal protein L4